MVGFFGTAVTICVAKAPLGPHCTPEEGNEFPGPESACPVAAVQFKLGIVVCQEFVLKATPLLGQTALEELGPPQVGLGLKKGSKHGVVDFMTALESVYSTCNFAMKACHEDLAKFRTGVIVL
jgi:hypothetical protein